MNDPPRPAPRLALASVPRHDTPVPLSEVRLDGDDEEAKSVDEQLEQIRKNTRAILGQNRETKNHLEAKIDRVEDRASLAHASMSRKLDDVAAAIARLEARPDHTIAIGHLAELVGRPPATIDPRSSNVQDLTPAQLADLETKGTGLFRLVGQLASADRTIVDAIATAAGRAAGTRSAIVTSITATAPAWAPLVYDAFSKLF